MKKRIRLTETELIGVIRKIIKENEQLLNQILDKINISGIKSLTDHEKEFLDRYSKGERPSSIGPEPKKKPFSFDDEEEEEEQNDERNQITTVQVYEFLKSKERESMETIKLIANLLEKYGFEFLNPSRNDLWGQFAKSLLPIYEKRLEMVAKFYGVDVDDEDFEILFRHSFDYFVKELIMIMTNIYKENRGQAENN